MHLLCDGHKRLGEILVLLTLPETGGARRQVKRGVRMKKILGSSVPVFLLVCYHQPRLVPGDRRQTRH